MRLEVDVACDVMTIVARRTSTLDTPRSPIAQLRWDQTTRRFALWRRNAITEWRPYGGHGLERHVDQLLFAIDEDPDGVFGIE